MNFKVLISSVVIASLTLASAIPSTYQVATNENFSNIHADSYDVSFKEIKKLYDFRNSVGRDYFVYWIAKDDIINPSSLPSGFWGSNNRAPLIMYKSTVGLCDSLASVYNFSWTDDESIIFDKIKNTSIVNVSMKITDDNSPGLFKVLSFSGQLKPKPPKDNIPLPDKTTDFNGTYKYSDIIKNLDYLMIKRKDFDKFDYSYLYWVPIFNFLYETQMDRRTIITVDGLDLKNVILDLVIADEVKLKPDRSFKISVDNKYFELKSSKDGLNSVLNFSLVVSGVERNVKLYFVDQEAGMFQFFTDFLNVFFGSISYLGNNYNFLRYDSFLNQDFLGLMDFWVGGGKMDVFGDDVDWFKNYKNNDIYVSIYKVLGDFFYAMFYATFDMDPSTRVKVDFHSDSDSWKDKNYYFELGFLYRSLITFYPKTYLLNGSYEGVNNYILFRSFYFLYDEKKHNGFVIGKTNYYISFNVLKMYDNLMFELPNSASQSTINRFDANFDVQYGINIFTVSFPLLTTVTENPNYTFYINDFNILNSTAFIPDNPDDADSDLIPVPNCNPTVLSASGWSCILKQTSVKVINYFAKMTGLSLLLKPIITISQTVITFFSSAFVVFHAVPALFYLFQFMLAFSLFVIIFRFFV